MRSCYEVDLKTFADNDTLTTRVRYYFVDQDTPFVQRPYFFAPRNWDLREWTDDDLGEVHDRSYKNGTPPYHVETSKQPCGTKEQWADGALTTDKIPFDWLGSLIPECCDKPPINTTGGVVLGGGLGTPPCGPCGVMPYFFNLHLSSAGPPCAFSDGLIIPMHFDISPCNPTSGFQALYVSETVTIGLSTGVFLLSCFCSSITPVYDLEFMVPDCNGTPNFIWQGLFSNCIEMTSITLLVGFLGIFGCPLSLGAVEFVP